MVSSDLRSNAVEVARVPPAGISLVVAAFLCACAGPTMSAEPFPNPLAVTLARASNICDGTMGFDVSGPYFASCRTYLVRNGRGTAAPGISVSDPATHRACEQAGLAGGTPDFDKCVQAMAQLDISSTHL